MPTALQVDEEKNIFYLFNMSSYLENHNNGIKKATKKISVMLGKYHSNKDVVNICSKATYK